MDLESYPRHSGTWKNNTILLLDPDEAIQLLYRDELSEEGYEVIPVTEAAQIIRHIDIYEPVLLVMETGLYGRNGLRLLRDIRQAHPDLPVIVCTADPSFKTEPNAQIADDVVLKGMSILELKESIKNVLNFRTLLVSGAASYPGGDAYAVQTDPLVNRMHRPDTKDSTVSGLPAIAQEKEFRHENQ